MTDIAAPRPRLAARLDGLAFCLLALVPLGMALLNRSAQPLLVAAALAGIGGCAARGEAGIALARLRDMARAPLGLAGLAFLAFAGLSIAWSGHPAVSAHAFGEFGLGLASGVVLHATLPREVPRWAVKLAVIAVTLGCLTIVAELASGMQTRIALKLRPDTFIFKRSITAILICAWPIAIWLWTERKTPIAVALMVLVGVAGIAAHSSGAVLALGVGTVALGLAASSRPASALLAGLFVAGTFILAPVLGDAADKLLPARFVQSISAAHARERIDIWQSFGEVVHRRPFFGEGFGTSPVMAKEPVAAEVPENRRLMLAVGHPHNGPLQIWAETGFVGAALAGIVLLFVARRLNTGSLPAGLAGAASFAAAASIMMVGHGAWQGWWVSVLGVAAIWISRLPDRRWDADRSPPRSRRRGP